MNRVRRDVRPARRPLCFFLLIIVHSLLGANSQIGSSTWCSTGFIAGATCCAGSCGACGGKDCTGLTGGKAMCCGKQFKRTCIGPQDHACIIPREEGARPLHTTTSRGDSTSSELKGLSWLLHFQKNFAKSKHWKPSAEGAQTPNGNDTSSSSYEHLVVEGEEKEDIPNHEETKPKKKKKKKKRTEYKATTPAGTDDSSTAALAARRKKKSIEACKLTDLGSVLRDIQSEFRDSRMALERIRASLGFIPDAFDRAWRFPHDTPIWGARSMWAPSDCGIAEETLKPSGCNRMCDRTVATHPSDGAYPYGVSKPVTVGKIRTCDQYRDMPMAAETAAAVQGYACIDKFPIMTFTGQGCIDDVTGVHVAPTFSKNRPLMFSFDGVNHESGVVMPFNFKHQFQLPRFYMDQLRNSKDGSVPETTWEEKKNGVVWRGALTAGPPPGVATVQRCGSAKGAGLSKLFRGRHGDLFVPGLPWKCRGRYLMKLEKKDKDEGKKGKQTFEQVADPAEVDCNRSARILRKQPSRLEMVQLWQHATLDRDGIDVKFRWDTSEKSVKPTAVLEACGVEKGTMVTNVTMSIGQQLRHKYILAVEGVDKSSNIQWVMMSNSVLVMPPPSQESWLLEGRLAPWVHYAPVRPDFKDLKDVVSWLREHDDEARRMARASKEYMKQFGDQGYETRVAAAVLRLYVAYTHAAATLGRDTPKENRKAAPVEGKLDMSGECWKNATWHAVSELDNFSPPPEHTAFLPATSTFRLELTEEGKAVSSKQSQREILVTVPVGLDAGDSFFVTVPVHENDPEFDPNGVAGVPYGARGFVPPVRIAVPPRNTWLGNAEFQVAVPIIPFEATGKVKGVTTTTTTTTTTQKTAAGGRIVSSILSVGSTKVQEREARKVEAKAKRLRIRAEARAANEAKAAKLKAERDAKSEAEKAERIFKAMEAARLRAEAKADRESQAASEKAARKAKAEEAARIKAEGKVARDAKAAADKEAREVKAEADKAAREAKAEELERARAEIRAKTAAEAAKMEEATRLKVEAAERVREKALSGWAEAEAKARAKADAEEAAARAERIKATEAATAKRNTEIQMRYSVTIREPKGGGVESVLDPVGDTKTIQSAKDVVDEMRIREEQAAELEGAPRATAVAIAAQAQVSFATAKAQAKEEAWLLAQHWKTTEEQATKNRLQK